MIEKKLGPYLIGDVLGQGGMGTVYFATDERTGTKAAVKVLPLGIASQGRMRERFEREIDTLVQLKHPNIVQLYGYGEEQGEMFYAMELVPGTNLSEQIKTKQKFSWRSVITTAIEIAKGLKHAHDFGIIHRDIKPANILIDPSDHPKIADFGIARLFGATSMTADGGIVGTADYMAPEQALGEPVTPRSDLYSLGSVMYAMLAGQSPFHGDSVAEVLHRLRYSEPVPIQRLVFDSPTELSKVIDQLLDKDPQKRFSNATTLIRRLERILNETDASQSNFELNIPSNETLVSSDDEYQLKLAQGSSADDIETMDSISSSPRPSSIAPDEATLASSSEDKQPVEEDREDHFTTLAEDRKKRKRDDYQVEHSSWGSILQTSGLILALFVIIGLILWTAQTPSADSLYEQITTTSETDSAEDANPQIELFLATYPEDARIAEIQEIQQEIELLKLERRYKIAASLNLKKNKLEPVEIAYVEALKLIQDSPEAASQKLSSLLALYSVGEKKSEKKTKCLTLAKRRLEQLNQKIIISGQIQVAEIQKQLNLANTLAESEPDKAHAMYQAIIDLYQEKPWAANVVAEAQAQLKKTTLPENSLEVDEETKNSEPAEATDQSDNDTDSSE